MSILSKMTGNQYINGKKFDKEFLPSGPVKTTAFTCPLGPILLFRRCSRKRWLKR